MAAFVRDWDWNWVGVGVAVGAVADEWPGLVNDSIGREGEHCHYGQIARVSLCSVLDVFVAASAAASASPEQPVRLLLLLLPPPSLLSCLCCLVSL